MHPSGYEGSEELNPNDRTLQRELVVLLLTAMSFFYPLIVNSVLSVFTCYRLEGKLHWVWQMDKQCYKGQHLALSLTVGLIGLIVGVALPPLLVLILLI